MVEQGTHKPLDVGSNPTLATHPNLCLPSAAGWCFPFSIGMCKGVKSQLRTGPRGIQRGCICDFRCSWQDRKHHQQGVKHVGKN
jgi:hypothetical protein